MFDPSKIPIPAELAPYTFPKVLSKRIGEWRECGTLDEILALKDGLSKDLAMYRRFTADGQQWARLMVIFGKSFVDLEILPSGNIGEVRPVPPEQAVPDAFLRKFTFPSKSVQALQSWKDHDTFDNLQVMYDGPFRSSYGFVRRFHEGTREFARMVEPPDPRFVDIEILPNGKMGEIRPVPPLEAFDETERRGWLQSHLDQLKK